MGAVKHRVKNSFGRCHHNKGTKIDQEEKPYVLDHSREFYLFDIVPMGAPRMTKSDTWKLDPNHPDPLKRQRPVVTRYFEFKNTLTEQALSMGFELKNNMEAVFLMPLPDSWSKKKKERMKRMPCKVRPDCDNILKGFVDALKDEDGCIWKMNVSKYWADTGSIIIFG
jgi:Holliday junction resolvase RusA-like endonuclease